MKRAPATLAFVIACTVAWAVGAVSPALAATAAALGSGPLSLDAADGVEWRREEHVFVAEGDAIARQGAVTLRGDRLVASYRDRPAGGVEIFRIDAEGAVRIENGRDIATGARAAFDLAARAIVLTGPGLSYVSGAATVTARDTLEYDLKTGRAVARGDAAVEDRRGRLTASVIEAQLTGSGGNTAGVMLARAWGGVVIQNGVETIRAERAAYDFAARRAEALGAVRITRGQSVLTGERATIDFNTGVSRLYGETDGKRVRGLIFPKASK